DRVTRGDIRLEQFIDPNTGRTPGIAQEFHPRRRIDQNHPARLARISSRSPSQPEPRSRRASSTPNGSAASVRKAKFTASRLVKSWYRSITARQASSSRSMFVRDIHTAYTNTRDGLRCAHNGERGA